MRAICPLCVLALVCACSRADRPGVTGASSAPAAPSSSASPELVAWQQVRSIELIGTAHHWEPQQSEIAGGPPRDIGEASFSLRDDAVSGQASITWSRKVKYPFTKQYDYVDVVNRTTGEVRGLDSWYFDSPPPPRALSTDHFAATWRLIRQLSPLGYLRGRAPELQADSDPATGLPVRLRVNDTDTVAGDSKLDVVLSEWKPAGRVLVPRSMSFMLNEQTLAEYRVDEVRIDPTDSPPAAPQLPLLQSDHGSGSLPYQWVLRREAMGGYSEDDSIAKQHLETVTDGVFLVAGRTHNSLIVEMQDHLVVVDAPLDNQYSEWILNTARERFPLKPVRTLVLTHHHNDHSGGARAFVAAGVEVMVGASNQRHFERMFAAPHRIDPDLLEKAPKPAHVTEVAGTQTLKSGTRSLQLIRIPNHHAEGMLVAFLPKERIAFVADLWSPERDQLRAPLTFERHRDLVEALRAAKITPQLIVGGHGTIGNYAELATSVDAGPVAKEPASSTTSPL